MPKQPKGRRCRQTRTRAAKGLRTNRLAMEGLEARLVLSAVGVLGNDCPPDLDLSAVAPQQARVGERFSFNLFSSGATVEDLDDEGNPTGDQIRLVLDPDLGTDTPTGASLSASGEFAWTPTAGQVGTFEIVVIAIDEGPPALADAETFTIVVAPPNPVPPVVDLNGDGAGTGAIAAFTEDGGPTTIVETDATVTDVDSTTLSSAKATITNLLDAASESLSVVTTGTAIVASYDPATGVLSLTGSDSLANYQQVLRTLKYNNLSHNPTTSDRLIDVVVNDGTSDSLPARATVSVAASNDAPNLAAVANQRAAVGQELVVTVTASDPDAGDVLTFALDPEDAPAGATITKTSATTAVIRWTPTAADLPGPRTFVVLVNDSGSPALSDSESFTTSVEEANVAPNLALIVDQIATVGQELTVNVTVSDANAGQTLTFFLDPENAPATATIEKTGATTAIIRWTPAASDAPGPVSFSVLVTDDGLPPLVDSETFEVDVDPAVPAALSVRVSPADGDELVSLTRETVVNFSGEVDPTTIDGDSLYLIAKGAKVPATIRVSPTNRFATVFYVSPLPESTEIRVVVDGDAITGADGMPVDADGDGVPGGVRTADFRTLPLTLIPNTRVFGYVYDSYNKNPDGSDIPVVGATISLDANPNIRAVTDATGLFELGLQDLNQDSVPDGLPAPDFFVHIDGSTATGAPAGAAYATMGKPFHSIPGQRTQLSMPGGPFHIYLPPMAMGDIVNLPEDAAANVGFGPSVTDPARLAELFPDLTLEQRALLALTQVTYPAGAAQNADGTPATLAAVIPVNPARLPAPLPPTVTPKLVISVQAGTTDGMGNPQFNLSGGSTNFDVPAPVTFPNLEGLAPGEKSLIWSFDHDAGKWVVIGTGTVSADGKAIVSDEGVGILAPGWHFTEPGVDGEGDPPNEDPDWKEITDVLNGDYASKIGTQDAALAHQIACLAMVACANGAEGEWGSEWVKDVLNDIAGDVARNPYHANLPSWVPDWFGAIPGGYSHFVDQLWPSFVKNCDHLDDDVDGNGKRDHTDFFDEAVVPCFDMVAAAGEIPQAVAWAFQQMVPAAAAALRETAQAYCQARDAIDTVEKLLDYARELFETGAQLVDFAGELYDNFNDLRDVIERLVDPLSNGIPLTMMSPTDWASSLISDLSNFVIETTTNFFMNVGETFNFSSLTTTRSGEFAASLADDAIEYVVIADPKVATMDPGGTLRLHGVENPFRNLPTPIFVVARQGDQIAYKVYAVRDLDSDLDGLVDSYETRIGLDPGTPNSYLQDLDGDGLTDLNEAAFGSSPLVRDTDGDGHNDANEIDGGGDPTDRGASPFVNQSRLYFAVENLETGLIQRGTTTDVGRISQVILSPNSSYRVAYLDAQTLKVGTAAFRTLASGTAQLLPVVELLVDSSIDTDGEGLRDLGEFILGTSSAAADTDGDGISDAAELAQGLNPLDGVAATTGAIAGIDLAGSAEALDVAGDLVVVSHGSSVSVIDTARFDRPIALGRVQLPAAGRDVAIDGNLAVVTTGLAVQIVDFSDPMAPTLRQTVSAFADHVETFGGFAYVASGTTLTTIDLASGDTVGRLTLPGNGSVTGLTRAADMLYAYVSGSDTVVAIELDNPEAPAVLGQLALNIAASDVGLFAENDVLWVVGSGLRTIDVSNPSAMQVIQTPSGSQFFTARQMALNGSGLGLLVPDGGNFVQVYDTSDPNVVSQLVTQFNLSGAARDVKISRGIGFVAAGNRLEVVNYRPFDALGVPPTVMIASPVADVDPNTPGIQVFEGTSIPVVAQVFDDVQARQVELLVNGQVVGRDVSFPFDLATVAPLLSSGVTTLNVQVRATDTGGNVTLSNSVEIAVVPDTIAPTIASITPADGGQIREGQNRTLRVRFSESLADSSIAGSAFVLRGAGPDGQFATSDDTTPSITVELRDDGQLVQIAVDELSLGKYRLEVNQSLIVDRAGNSLGQGVFESEFEAVETMTLFQGGAPDIVFVIDISGSTRNGFSGTPVGDVNGDGIPNTILDAELASLIVLNQELVNLGFATSARVAIVAFDNAGAILDMNPVEPGVQSTAAPSADVDGNGVRDVEQVLATLRDQGGTNFEGALQRAIEVFNALGTPAGEGNLVFLSDGQGSGFFADEIQTLENLAINRLAFGVGAGASLAQLQQIDARAQRVTSTDEFLDAILGTGDGAALAAASMAASLDVDEVDQAFAVRWEDR